MTIRNGKRLGLASIVSAIASPAIIAFPGQLHGGFGGMFIAYGAMAGIFGLVGGIIAIVVLGEASSYEWEEHREMQVCKMCKKYKTSLESFKKDNAELKEAICTLSLPPG